MMSWNTMSIIGVMFISVSSGSGILAAMGGSLRAVLSPRGPGRTGRFCVALLRCSKPSWKGFLTANWIL